MWIRSIAMTVIICGLVSLAPDLNARVKLAGAAVIRNPVVSSKIPSSGGKTVAPPGPRTGVKDSSGDAALSTALDLVKSGEVAVRKTFGAGSMAVDIRVKMEMPRALACLNNNYVQKGGHCVLDCHQECIDCEMAHNDKACRHCVNMRIETNHVIGNISIKETRCVPECPARYGLSDRKLCALCQAGAFKGTEGNYKCTPCAEGTFTNSVGSTVCTESPPGNYVEKKGSTLFQPCPPGTAAKAYGSVRCSECYPGSFSVSGRSECTPCPAGYYANSSRNSACHPCLAGFFADTIGQTQCKQCPIGLTSQAGSVSCSYNCPRGEFSPASNATCRKCPPGTFAGSTGATSCTPCEKGTYSIDTGSTSCMECYAGYFSSKFGASWCYPCPGLTYSDRDGSDACTRCPEDSCSKPGSVSCTPCKDNVTKIYMKHCEQNGVYTRYHLKYTCHRAIDNVKVHDFYFGSCSRNNPQGEKSHWTGFLNNPAVIVRIEIFSTEIKFQAEKYSVFVESGRDDPLSLPNIRQAEESGIKFAACTFNQETNYTGYFPCEPMVELATHVVIEVNEGKNLILCEVEAFGYYP